jgi:hypothetical protein
MSKTLTPKQLRRQKKQLDYQMEQERNGAPIPGDILARMTKPKDETLYQIWVEVFGKSEPIPICPKMPEEFCEAILIEINAQISLGKEKKWANPHILACIPLE